MPWTRPTFHPKIVEFVKDLNNRGYDNVYISQLSGISENSVRWILRQS